mmetsp:Transcript_28974/g.27885  ORF Transcript_28974/g.27885 Transcript_28974/m.27885 type:complete len:130 (-) Transcript_28974:304-693(-)|eukprot:CAMPEP_0197832018 /NCGR_PEP_ID=MMETSP1437-20131217/12904_1 /TAXON_ID=49252 ORGANISM="Eucampia antarctica, Strain CCMP1452" /NCGR_SAMPLE_ID=MMETSP1437 /ASSEMBLY_ACC=CAM_ASM_001096 /LENGTH=129 /DNA_ID=CAMNT_0043435179 /DNA_START=172 /DNA_END=561 /DNA_ORIENTATION=-
MGKGSNVQKAQAARERNQKKLGKTDEERRAASAKATKDSTAYSCLICRQSFMVNAKLPLLHLHVISKHKTLDPVTCFPELAGYDPDNPEGKVATTTAKKIVPKKKKKTEDSLDSLLDAGLGKKKGKGKK